MLTLDSIVVRHDGRPTLDGVSLTVAPGAVAGLLGPSGAGKTTLLQIAAGLRRPDAGAVSNGFARTAIVFQEPRLLPWRTALANIAFGLKALGSPRAARRERAERLAARLGLTAADTRKYPHELSGGMRQRVAIGRALAVEPDLLLLDEPFSALDVGLRRELQDLVRGLIDERGLAALFVTHDIAEAARLADGLIVLSPVPARVVHHSRIERPFAERDDAFVFETAAAFLRAPAVATAFGR
jgi:NitT/TauT family transport system ATP-binding protein